MVQNHHFLVKLSTFYYGVELDGRINYDRVMDIAKICQPKLSFVELLHTLEIDFKKFREIADAVGAILFADIAHILWTCCSLVNICLHSLI